MSPIYRCVTFLTAVLFFQCCDDEPAVRVTTRLEPISSQEQFTYWGTILEPIKVRVSDSKGPLQDVVVTFAAVDENVMITNVVDVTDANGIAFAFIAFKENFIGKTEIEVSTAGIKEKISFTFKVSKSKATRILLVEGNNQQYIRGHQAPLPLVVLVTDDFGNPAVDMPVKFMVHEGFGEVPTDEVITNEYGQAETSFMLSDSTSVNSVSASIPGDTVQFSLVSLFPSELLPFSQTFTDITISWQKSNLSDFTQYVLRRTEINGSGESKTIATIADIKTTNFIDTDVTLKAIYNYELIVETERGLELKAKSQSIVFGMFAALEFMCEDIEIDVERNQVYVSVPDKNSIYIVDLATLSLTNKIVVGSQPTGLLLSKDGSTLYIGLSGSGEVAFLNLTSRAIVKVNVSAALGNNKVYDMLEAAPHQIFVVANPGNYGSATLAIIKTDQSNSVERFYNAYIRFNPIMQADYGNTLYVLSGGSLFEIDLRKSYLSTDFYNPDHYLSDESKEMCLSPDNSTLYFSGFSLSSDSFALKNTFPIGIPIVNPNGNLVHYFSAGKIFTYNTSTGDLVDEMNFQENVIRKAKIMPDGSRMIILSSDYNSGDRLFVLSLKK